jgi:hypothetical protein
MPAIELARLKIQTARLAEKFGEPQAFLRDLNELLGFYTNLTIRATQTARRLSLSTFHTPRPVLRQIENELTGLAGRHPTEALALTDVLWEGNSLESRLLAAYLLGIIPPTQAVPALMRLPAWLNQTTDEQVRVALLSTALVRLRRENPQAFFTILEGWLSSARAALQIWGLQALIPLLQDPQFENLPAVFRILRPAVLAASPATQLDFQACLAALEKVSRTETVAFLREIISSEPPPLMLRIFRRILPALSPELQAALRELLREQNS